MFVCGIICLTFCLFTSVCLSVRLSVYDSVLKRVFSCRELDHPNIVRYYGATYRFENEKQKTGMQWIMLMELCECTLKHCFLEEEKYSPGKHTLDSTDYHAAMVSMSTICSQLTSGVKYLHEKGFVHRDLKLENILVSIFLCRIT